MAPEPAHPPVNVAVVGGGIIGRAVAAAVARRGATVVVVEAGGPTFGTSSANAGHLVPSHVIPFAAPGMVRAGLRSWRRRDGAFALSWRAGPGLAPWLARFAASANAGNVAAGVPVLRTLLDATMAEVHRLHAAGADLDFVPGGLVQVCTTASGWDGVRHEADELRAAGVEVTEMTRDELLAAEPLARDVVRGAVVLAGDARVDPARLLAAVAAEGARHGVTDLDAVVTELVPGTDGVTVRTTAGELSADEVVVAAGVWTAPLLRSLGVRLPIRAAKGYSVTVPSPDPALGRPMLLVDQRLACSPLTQGLRITGRFELTSHRDRGVPPDAPGRLVHRADEALRLGTVAPANPWTGLRPATPDGLPVIGRLVRHPRVIVAAGHGMLGSSAGLGTGQAVAALVAGEVPLVNPGVVAPERFDSSLAAVVRSRR